MSAAIRRARATKAKLCDFCPWRVDSVGRVCPSDVAELRRCITEDLPQACHRCPRRLCAGFLKQEGPRSVDVAFLAARMGVDVFRDLESPTPLFESWAELFAAHGVEAT